MNGNVKVILVGGFSVMFGFYAFMIQGFNNTIMQIGDQKSYYTEARMNATAGLNYAIYQTANPNTWNVIKHNGTVSLNNLLVGGDTVSYVIDNFSSSDSSARVTVVASFGGVAAKQIAVIKRISDPPYNSANWWNNKKTWNGYFWDLFGKWQVVKVYVYPYQLPTSELS